MTQEQSKILEALLIEYNQINNEINENLTVNKQGNVEFNKEVNKENDLNMLFLLVRLEEKYKEYKKTYDEFYYIQEEELKVYRENKEKEKQEEVNNEIKLNFINNNIENGVLHIAKLLGLSLL